jgi:hypothetical protein
VTAKFFAESVGVGYKQLGELGILISAICETNFSKSKIYQGDSFNVRALLNLIMLSGSDRINPFEKDKP